MNLNEFKKIINQSEKIKTIRVYESLYNEIQNIAKNEKLSVTKLVQYIFHKFIEDYKNTNDKRKTN